MLGDTRTIDLDESFVVILSWDGLHLLSRSDQRLMAERVAAWLQPGGRLLSNTVPRAEDDLDGFRSGTRFRDDLSAGDDSAALARRGLIEVAHIENDPSCAGAGVWLIRKP